MTETCRSARTAACPDHELAGRRPSRGRRLRAVRRERRRRLAGARVGRHAAVRRPPGAPREERRGTGSACCRSVGPLSVYLRGLLHLLRHRYDVVVDVQNGVPFWSRLVARGTGGRPGAPRAPGAVAGRRRPGGRADRLVPGVAGRAAGLPRAAATSTVSDASRRTWSRSACSRAHRRSCTTAPRPGRPRRGPLRHAAPVRRGPAGAAQAGGARRRRRRRLAALPDVHLDVVGHG